MKQYPEKIQARLIQIIHILHQWEYLIMERYMKLMLSIMHLRKCQPGNRRINMCHQLMIMDMEHLWQVLQPVHRQKLLWGQRLMRSLSLLN